MKVESQTREREVTTTVTENVIILELTTDEAAALVAAFGRMNGWVTKNNLRETTGALYEELTQIPGLDWNSENVQRFARRVVNSLTLG